MMLQLSFRGERDVCAYLVAIAQFCLFMYEARGRQCTLCALCTLMFVVRKNVLEML